MRVLALGLLLVLLLSACENPVQNSKENTAEPSPEKTVILVHGYGKGPGDMETLAGFLEAGGYRAITVDLPLTFDHVQEAADIFAEKVKEIVSGMPDKKPVSMVGHSTGGLVIRYFLSHYPDYGKVDNAVLIATPNRGSRLAGMAADISDLIVETFATLDSLRPDKISGLKLSDPEDTRIGAIAGTKSNLALGQLLEKENDGRVEVESVYYPELDDFAVVPFNHNEIHHRKETASMVIQFLRSGFFEGHPVPSPDS
ncbi:MAG: alpha/beta fold hydrolase [Desulfosalsimonas sp.]